MLTWRNPSKRGVSRVPTSSGRPRAWTQFSPSGASGWGELLSPRATWRGPWKQLWGHLPSLLQFIGHPSGWRVLCTVCLTSMAAPDTTLPVLSWGQCPLPLESRSLSVCLVDWSLQAVRPGPPLTHGSACQATRQAGRSAPGCTCATPIAALPASDGEATQPSERRGVIEVPCPPWKALGSQGSAPQRCRAQDLPLYYPSPGSA